MPHPHTVMPAKAGTHASCQRQSVDSWCVESWSGPLMAGAGAAFEGGAGFPVELQGLGE